MLATMAQCLVATGLCSLLWFAVGYSLAFTGEGAVIGSLERVFLAGHGNGRDPSGRQDDPGSRCS